MIYFSLIPVKFTDKINFLVREDHTFFCTPLKSLNHTKALKKALKKQFGINFNISKSFYALNDGEDILIYTLVIPTEEFSHPDYYWTNILNPKDFNEFDELAIRRLNLEF